jgi:hypothetical protein
MKRLRLYRYYLTLRAIRAVIRYLKQYTVRLAAKVSATPYN